MCRLVPVLFHATAKASVDIIGVGVMAEVVLPRNREWEMSLAYVTELILICG